MKKLLSILSFLFCLLCFSYSAHSQIVDRLKSKAKSKVDQRADEKVDRAMDKTLDDADNATKTKTKEKTKDTSGTDKSKKNSPAVDKDTKVSVVDQDQSSIKVY